MCHSRLGSRGEGVWWLLEHTTVVRVLEVRDGLMAGIVDLTKPRR